MLEPLLSEGNNQNIIRRKICQGSNFDILGTPTILNSLFCRIFEGKSYTNFWQLCDSLHERRFYHATGCGRSLHPNVNVISTLKQLTSMCLIVLWTWSISGIHLAFLTSNKWLTLMQVMDSQILLVCWENC